MQTRLKRAQHSWATFEYDVNSAGEGSNTPERKLAAVPASAPRRLVIGGLSSPDLVQSKMLSYSDQNMPPVDSDNKMATFSYRPPIRIWPWAAGNLSPTGRKDRDSSESWSNWLERRRSGSLIWLWLGLGGGEHTLSTNPTKASTFCSRTLAARTCLASLRRLMLSQYEPTIVPSSSSIHVRSNGWLLTL